MAEGTEKKKEEYFAAYLVIQTSDPTENQYKFAELLTKFVKENEGVLYITIQSGKPGNPPPCGPGGCP